MTIEDKRALDAVLKRLEELHTGKDNGKIEILVVKGKPVSIRTEKNETLQIA